MQREPALRQRERKHTSNDRRDARERERERESTRAMTDEMLELVIPCCIKRCRAGARGD